MTHADACGGACLLVRLAGWCGICHNLGGSLKPSSLQQATAGWCWARCGRMPLLPQPVTDDHKHSRHRQSLSGGAQAPPQHVYHAPAKCPCLQVVTS